MEKRSSTSESGLSGRWSSRLLILAILGALFLTLFPFHFVLHARVPGNRSPFLLGGRGKDSSWWNVFLNVLLFIPFGFALSDKLRERGRSWAETAGWSLLLGALFSYGIEFLQLYTTGRDSGWEDILTNGTGAMLGSISFLLWGGSILSHLSKSEGALESLLTRRRAIAVITTYFAAWFALSALVQMETRLSNWHPEDLLIVGNDAAGGLHSSWKGEVFRLQFWNRALPEEIAPRLHSGDTVPDLQTGLLVSYDFSAPGSLRDQKAFLPGLSWAPGPPDQADPPYVALDGKNWLTSQIPVPNLVNAVQKANQFAVRVVFKPLEISGIDASIVSLSRRKPNLVDVEIGQQNTTLILRLRNSLAGNRSAFVWLERNTLAPNQAVDLLFSYDGATASLYLNGTPMRSYRLGPGALVGRFVHDVRPSALDLYACGYYFAVFFAGGILTGIAARNIQPRRPRIAFLTLGILIPALLLEFTLVGVSGRSISFGFTAFSIAVGIAGAVWINAGAQPQRDGDHAFARV